MPIYLGAPNVALDFLPTPTSALLASDFGSSWELAREVMRLDGDDRAYKRMLVHKRKYAGPDDKPIANKCGQKNTEGDRQDMT